MEFGISSSNFPAYSQSQLMAAPATAGGRRPITRAVYPVLATGHSALAAGRRTNGPALVAAARPVHWSVAAASSGLYCIDITNKLHSSCTLALAQPNNRACARLRCSTSERGIPSLLKGSDSEERIASDITQLVGWTPLVELNRVAAGCGARIIGKLEFYQPFCSIKDRAALRMIEDAEEKNLITPGETTLVKVTSGNMGISIAYITALKRYKFTAIMPAGYSLDKEILLRYLGANVVLTPPELDFDGMTREAEKLKNTDPNVHILSQFSNAANPQAHFMWTGPEIWKDTAGKIDIFVAGSGTGGTISGVGRYLKEKNPDIKVICVEPAESCVISRGKPGWHKIQGIGPGFVPENHDRDIIDETIVVTSQYAMENARRLAMEEGLLVGISSGANLSACLKVAARKENKGKMIVTVFPSGGERYKNSELFREAREEPKS